MSASLRVRGRLSPVGVLGRQPGLGRRRFYGRWVLLLCGLAAVLSSSAAAQTISGTVTEQETGTPIRGALVTLLDASGRERQTLLSDTTGRFVFRPPAGRYRVAAQYIGRATVRSDELVLAGEVSLQVRLDAPIAAVLLKPLVVENRRGRCGMDPAVAEQAMSLWEEARTALRISTAARRSRPYTVRLFSRWLDPIKLRLLWAEARDSSATAIDPFRSEPEQDLLQFGYVRRDPPMMVFNGPDEAVLLSNGFLEHHCLQLLKGSGSNRGEVGVAFEAAETPVTEISGVAWLDAKTAELRVVDFTYTHLEMAYGPHVPGLVPPRQGGRLEFGRSPEGMFVMRRWWLGMPVTDGALARQYVPALPVRPDGYIQAVLESGGELIDATRLRDAGR